MPSSKPLWRKIVTNTEFWFLIVLIVVGFFVVDRMKEETARLETAVEQIEGELDLPVTGDR